MFYPNGKTERMTSGLILTSLLHLAALDSVCTIQAAPSVEHFEDSAWQIGAVIFSDPGELDPCWSRTDTAGYYWTPYVGITSGGFSGPYNGVGGSGKYLYTSPTGPGPSSTSLITPRYYVASLDTPAIEFYTHILAFPSSNFQSFVVAADTGSGWFPLQTFTSSTQTTKLSPWDRHVLYLNPFRADTMQFKFTVNRSLNAFLKVGLDEFSIKDSTCTAIFSPFTYSGTGLTRSFSCTNPKPNYSYQWLFGDGSSSQSLNPTHSYSSTGSFTITLVTASECGRIDSSQATIQVCNSIQPSILTTINGNTVSFNSQGQGIASAYWSFGDGGSSTLLNPVHTYSNTGAFAVQLVVTNSCGETFISYETVILCSELSPQFTAQVISTNAQGMTVQFDGSYSLGNIASYQWNFGDNSTGTGLAPLKTYATPGFSYIVTLTTLDDCSQDSSISKPLTQVSLTDTQTNDLLLYPNPAEVYVFLTEPPGDSFMSASLFLPNGMCVDTYPSGTQMLDIRHLPPGLYYLVLTYPMKVATLPLLISPP